MADNEMQNTLREIDLEIASLDSQIECKGWIIDMLRVVAENPPNMRQIEERLNTALAELIGLVARHNELKNNKMTLGADHINNGGAGDAEIQGSEANALLKWKSSFDNQSQPLTIYERTSNSSIPIEEVKLVHVKRTSNSSIPIEEAGMLLRALESDWDELCEEIGLWIPAQVVNEEHDDKPEGTEDFEEEILPGRPLPP
ncbi:hypothetical protein P8452_43925 [Trifolium repens]|nr:hypothetical protein P8452_43925 [Trifolium repens]